VADALERRLQYLASDPDNAPLRYSVAYLLALAGRYSEAKEHLERLPEAGLLLARVHHYLGDVTQAISLAEAYAAAYPDDSRVAGELAMLYLDARELAKARAWVERAMAGEGRTAEALCSAGWLAIGEQEEDRAEALLDQALEQNPASGRAWVGKGLTAMLRGDLAAAEEPLARAAAGPMAMHVGTWLTLAWCQLLQGKLDAAEASARQAYTLERAFGETHGTLAVIEALRGEETRARRRADTALRLDPGSLGGRYALLLVEASSGEEHAKGVHDILASERLFSGGTLLEFVTKRISAGLAKETPAASPPGPA
jgi:tetratricopeptide (TPR) repeat protein